MGNVKVTKCDIDANPQAPSQYGVRSIPTILMFKGGEVVGQLVGAVPRPKLEGLIKDALAISDQAKHRPKTDGVRQNLAS